MSRFVLAAGLRPNIAARVFGGLIIALVVILLASRPADSATGAEGVNKAGPAPTGTVIACEDVTRKAD